MSRFFHKGIIGLLCLAGMFTLAVMLTACDDDGDDPELDPVERADLEGQTFVFPDPRAFGVQGRQLTLTIGTFSVEGLDQDDLAAITIASGSGTATGLMDVDEEGDVSECDIRIDVSTIAELPTGTVLRFGPCETNDRTGELFVVNEQTGIPSTSLAP